MTDSPTVEACMRRCQRTALHLEMRDAYTQNDPMLDGWRRGHREDASNPSPHWKPWLDLISETTARGVAVLRARVVSEPISEYIRYEFDLAHVNLAVGEQVRWLPRRQATAIALPGNDFWLFDDEVLLINHFAGNGDSVGKELISDPDVVRLCASAFEAVWTAAIPHSDYHPD